MSTLSTFADRLRQVLGHEAIYAFSRRSGVSDTALRSYMKGSVPGLDKVLLIAQAAKVSVYWLATGDGDPDPDQPQRTTDSEFVYIPCLDVEVSAGPGVVAHDETMQGVVAFDAQWLRAQTNCNPSKLSLVTVKGDSMSPTLEDGDMIFVDHSSTDYRDGIHVFQMEGDLLVKRLQKLPGSSISVISDNPRFPAFTVDLTDSSCVFKLIGQYKGRLSFD